MIAFVLVLAVSVPRQAVEATPRSMYRVKPLLDASIIGVSAFSIILPYAFASDLIHPHCPCDPAAVNALDRHVIERQDS